MSPNGYPPECKQGMRFCREHKEEKNNCFINKHLCPDTTIAFSSCKDFNYLRNSGWFFSVLCIVNLA